MAAPLKRAYGAISKTSSRQIQIPSGKLLQEPNQPHPLLRPSRTSRTTLAQQRRPYTQFSRLSATPSSPPLEDDHEAPLPASGDLSSLAHSELAQHREIRELTRVAAWEMPLLASLTKPFSPPTQPLRWRYTTYFGDVHPAARKVVLEFHVAAFPSLSAKQKDKLRKLCGPRYNPQRDVVKMSCESFETQAQNKRYLGDTVQKLVAECVDPTADGFEDVPLDTRHYKAKKVFRFPREWNLTPERREMLEAGRKARLLAEGARVEEGRIADGIAAIEAARQVEVDRVEEPVMASARQALPRGKMGKKEMGQRAR